MPLIDDVSAGLEASKTGTVNMATLPGYTVSGHTILPRFNQSWFKVTIKLSPQPEF